MRNLALLLIKKYQLQHECLHLCIIKERLHLETEQILKATQEQNCSQDFN